MISYPNQFTSGSQAVRESPLANSADVDHTYQKSNSTAHSPYPPYNIRYIDEYTHYLLSLDSIYRYIDQPTVVGVKVYVSEY